MSRRRGLLRLSVAGLGLLGAGALPAAPVVLYDSGHTAPLAPYLATVQVKPQTPPPIPVPDAAGLSARLPVRTQRLRPGRLTAPPSPQAQARLAHLPVPLFIVGADPFSLQWLVQNRARLHGALGLLIQAETAEDLARVRQAAAGLPILVVPGDALAEALGLTVYPLRLSREGVSQ